MTASDFFARWRVRLGYVLAPIVLLLARPTLQSILVGGLIGIIGLAIRAYAAGYLHKKEILTTTGPYAYTRNPLYFGSSFLALGAAISMHSVIGGALLIIYFSVVYSFVMRREECELRAKHADSFYAYAISVPLFFPRLTPHSQSIDSPGAFTWSQYKKNHEYEATIGLICLMLALLLIRFLRSR
jgi:protein-S-isoprenylcysteine O-methyltransferase Ste14